MGHPNLRTSVGTLTIFGLILSTLACNLSSALPQSTSPTDAESATELDTSPAAQAPSVADLAKSTVQVIPLVLEAGAWSPVWTGSGSVVSIDGLVLTNAHVVDDRYDEFEAIGVAITKRSDESPELMYLAEIAAIDYGLDLAVIRVVSDLDGNEVQVALPSVEVGDSDEIEIGEHLRILGYPGIGGGTISFTEGAVSGFTRARGVEGRAWVKTDATIAGGSSGGMGANEDGQLVGIPTIVTSGAEDGQTVDCRPLADTNRDGVIDTRDTCVPVGGFINALRPVNLALPLIEAARAGEQYAREAPAGIASPAPLDVSETYFSGIEFSDGVTQDDQPAGVYDAFPSGATDVCVFWDYHGMQDGMRWSLFWFRNGAPQHEYSSLDEGWAGGAQGTWWACVFNSEGLEDGLYEVIFEIDGEAITSDSVFVGGDRSLALIELINRSGQVLCYVYISPTMAQNWGLDELGETEVVNPGESRKFTLATGMYDVLIEDCDGFVLYEQYDVQVSSDTTITYP